jgi:23S rRNA (cytidine1920-2'-O)/16S rRNA (cytidine1409-2'-O)-methyltransferase
MPYVSRGGVKLAHALSTFGVDVKDLVVVDVGASTGGFTDCLLALGAQRVYAIDVGYGQLHDKLRRDPRVIVMERCNARHLSPSDLPEVLDLVVIDASFIGLNKLLPAALLLLRPAGEVLALVKPQFEVGRGAVGKGGVVRDQVARQAAIARVIAEAEVLGFECLAQADAVIAGPEGNQEHFVYLRKRREP